MLDELKKLILDNLFLDSDAGFLKLSPGLRIDDKLPYIYNADNTQRSTTSTAYIAETNIDTTLTDLKAGDIVKVNFGGFFWSSAVGKTCMSYIAETTGNGTRLNQAYLSAESQGTYSSSAELTQLWEVIADGSLTFRPYWRVYPSAGTVYCAYRRLIAHVISRKAD